MTFAKRDVGPLQDMSLRPQSTGPLYSIQLPSLLPLGLPDSLTLCKLS